MSMSLMVQAFSLNLGCPARKLILLKLADNANENGYCWPSYQYIADKCEVSKRTVITHIKKLEKDGYLEKELRPGSKGNTSNMYRLRLEKTRGENISPPLVIEDHPPGDPISPPPGEMVAPRISHSLESVIEPIKDLVENEFDILWRCWPNTKNKKLSLKAWVSLCNKNKEKKPWFLRESLVQDIHKRIANKQFAFEKTMLSSYLNGERWLDGHEAPENRADPLLADMGLT